MELVLRAPRRAGARRSEASLDQVTVFRGPVKKRAMNPPPIRSTYPKSEGAYESLRLIRRRDETRPSQ